MKVGISSPRRAADAYQPEHLFAMRCNPMGRRGSAGWSMPSSGPGCEGTARDHEFVGENPAAHRMADAPDASPRGAPRSRGRRIVAGLRRIARTGVAAVVIALLLLLGLRAYQSGQGPPLRPWHTIVPKELRADAIAHSDWKAWVAAETRMFDQLHRRLQAKMEPGDRTLLNRYHDPSRASPATFGRDWNRSFVLEPADAARRGRAAARPERFALQPAPPGRALYPRRVSWWCPRMPGHGTAPGLRSRSEGRIGWRRRRSWPHAKRAARPAGGALPRGGLFQRRGAGAQVRDGRARGGPGTRRGPSGWCWCRR